MLNIVYMGDICKINVKISRGVLRGQKSALILPLSKDKMWYKPWYIGTWLQCIINWISNEYTSQNKARSDHFGVVKNTAKRWNNDSFSVFYFSAHGRIQQISERRRDICVSRANVSQITHGSDADVSHPSLSCRESAETGILIPWKSGHHVGRRVHIQLSPTPLLERTILVS